MIYLHSHGIIVAYRIEDENGNSPFIVSSTKNHFSENVYPDYGDYCFAYLNPNKFLESEYYPYYKSDKYYLFEYLINPHSASVSRTGAVSFRLHSALSKTKLVKGLISWQEDK